MAFAFNLPVVFMDTNIRRVYIHEFFQDRDDIHDDELVAAGGADPGSRRPEEVVQRSHGLRIHAEERDQVNPNRRSAHYTRQSPFENSNRQVRGAILKALVKEAPLSEAAIVARTGMTGRGSEQNLVQLEKEGFVRKQGRSLASELSMAPCPFSAPHG